jgi:hypothetical protein
MTFPVLSQQGLEPGVYAEFIPSTSLANPPGGLRILCLVGTGISTATVSGEIVTKGALNSTDALHFNAVALPATITDQNFIIYDEGVDYTLASGGVDWNQMIPATQLGNVAASSFNGLSNTILNLVVNGSMISGVTFSGPNPISIGSVVSQINSTIGSFVTASATGGNQVKIVTNTTNDSTLLIGPGSANSILGFVEGLTTFGSKQPAQGIQYTITYSRMKTLAGGDYAPQLFFDINSVLAWSGPITVDGNNNIVYSIPMAAYLAFQNGASAVMVAEINPADATPTSQLIAFQNAINTRLTTVDLNIVVCLGSPYVTGSGSDPALYPTIQNHVDTMSSLVEQRFRTALIGMAGNPSIPAIQTIAQGLHDRRIALIYPPQATVIIPNDNTPVNLDGSYIAACIGGIRVNPAFDVAEPLLRKELFGLNTIQDTLLRTQKNVLANSGVMICEYQSGVQRVRDGLTTNLTTVDSAEYSVTEIIDFTATTCQSFLSAAFIGTKLLPDTPNLVQASLSVILNSLVNSQILSNFQNITVVQDPINPTQIDISFQIAPIFPVKYILIQFTI